jgi:chemotaxis protein CheY-P-specific phosphatase CheC
MNFILSSSEDGWTGIAFVNIDNSPASVTLTAYDDFCTIVATETMNVSGYAKVVNIAEDIFTQDISTATYINYSSDKEVVGFQLNGSSGGMMLDGLPGM